MKVAGLLFVAVFCADFGYALHRRATEHHHQHHHGHAHLHNDNTTTLTPLVESEEAMLEEDILDNNDILDISNTTIEYPLLLCEDQLAECDNASTAIPSSGLCNVYSVWCHFKGKCEDDENRTTIDCLDRFINCTNQAEMHARCMDMEYVPAHGMTTVVNWCTVALLFGLTFFMR